MTDHIAAMRQAREALMFGLHVGFDESSERQMKKGSKAFKQHHSAIAALDAALAKVQEPIDMVLHCPKCGKQHIDAPEGRALYADEPIGDQSYTPIWSNPPHRSHLCHGCGHIWRPADVATNGVEAVKTKGKADSPAAPQPALAKAQEPVAFDGYLCRAWGETELPAAQVVPDLDGVRAFMVREWLGSNDDPTLADVMAEIEGRDWKDEGEWSAKFEIGGVSVELVYSYAAPPAPAATALTDVEIWKFWTHRPEVAEGGDDSMEAEFTAAVRRAIKAAILKGQQ